MTIPNAKRPVRATGNLVWRKIANRPPLPVVRVPPRPSYPAFEGDGKAAQDDGGMRAAAGSLPPVAASWPPSTGRESSNAGSSPASPSHPSRLIACGIAAVGALVAVAAAVMVVPRPTATPAVFAPVRAAAVFANRAKETAVHSTPWVEVPPVAGSPVAADPSTVPATDLPAVLPISRRVVRPKAVATPTPTTSSSAPAVDPTVKAVDDTRATEAAPP